MAGRAVAVAGGIVLGPMVPAAYSAVEGYNRYKLAEDAKEAAEKTFAQAPLAFDRETSVGGGLEFKGTFILVLVFIVIMYIIFKD